MSERGSYRVHRSWDYFAPWLLLSLASLAILAYAFAQDRWLDCGDTACTHDLVGHVAAANLTLNEGGEAAYDEPRVSRHLAEEYERPDAKLFYFYPPHHLLFFRWLAAFPYEWVEIIHLSLSLLAWWGTLFLLTRDWKIASAGLLAGGGVLYSLWWIHHGILISAAIMSALAWTATRPRLSGLLLALATFKPTLGTLIPFALVAGRRWTAFASAAGVTIILALAATATFGVDIWAAWWSELGDAAAIVEKGKLWVRFQNVFNLFLPIAGREVAMALHVIVAIAAATITIHLWWRRDGDEAARIAALACALLLVPPYSYLYDFPMVSAAAIMLWARRGQMIGMGPRWTLPIAVGLTMFPAQLASTGGPVACLLILWVALRVQDAACQTENAQLVGEA